MSSSQDLINEVLIRSYWPNKTFKLKSNFISCIFAKQMHAKTNISFRHSFQVWNLLQHNECSTKYEDKLSCTVCLQCDLLYHYQTVTTLNELLCQEACTVGKDTFTECSAFISTVCQIFLVITVLYNSYIILRSVTMFQFATLFNVGHRCVWISDTNIHYTATCATWQEINFSGILWKHKFLNKDFFPR